MNRPSFPARRIWLSALSIQMCGVTAGVAADAPVSSGFVWHNTQDWGVEGRGWIDTHRYFDRLPAKAEGVVRPPVWTLSRHSAGMVARFRTDATAIRARTSLLSKSLAMPNMSATGVSGLDLYGRDAAGEWRWVGVTKPSSPTYDGELAVGLDGELREYMVYLPLYNGTESLEIGIPEGAAFEGLPPRPVKPIVFYGTSILHGASASRPGMAFPAILGRRFDRPVLNLGFSGNGLMEPEVADLLAELDPVLYVIDCLPNMQAPEISERAAPLVRRLRAAHPDTPILLVEDRTYANASFKPASRARHDASRAALRAAYDELLREGVPNLHYLEGERLLGDDGEATVDSSHPSDLGMVRMADALTPVLRPLLTTER